MQERKKHYGTIKFGNHYAYIAYICIATQILIESIRWKKKKNLTSLSSNTNEQMHVKLFS